MSESHDISDIDTHTMPDFPVSTPDVPLDFGPLFTDDTEDEDITQLPMSAPSSRKRWLIWLSVILLLILLGGTAFAIRYFRRAPAVTYTQAAATVGNLTVTATGTGPVQPAAVYNLNFPTSAPVSSINVQVGQQVHQGDVLATLDPTALQDAINQAQNNVNAAQSSVNAAVNSLNNTRTQEATALNIAQLTEQKAISACTPSSGGSSGTPTPTPTPDPNCIRLAQAQFTQAQNQANAAITQAQNQVTSANQQLTSAQAALQTAQDNMKNATLLAPANGVIDAINGRVGENAGNGNGNSTSGSSGNAGGSGGSGSSGGSNSASAFIVLVDASTLNVAAQINEADIANVAVNQPATFTVAAYPSQTFRATVTSIDTLGTASSNVVSYLVDLAVDMQSLNKANLYPNMTATVNITTAERIGVLLVPSAALSFPTTAIQNGELSRNDLRSLISNGALRQGAGSGSRGIVLELKNGKLVPVLVTTGLTNGQFTEITSGLNEGDQVVVSQTGGTTTGGNNGGFGGGRGGGGGGGGGIINGNGRGN